MTVKKLLLLLSVIILGSCSAYKSVKIDILSPSPYDIPLAVQNIVIVNNAEEQDSTIGHSTFKVKNIYPRKKKISSDTIKVDSATTAALHSMYNQIDASQFHPSVKIANITKNSISKTLTNSSADALLVLEKLKYTDNLMHTVYEYYNIDDTELEVMVTSKWSLYYSDKSIAPHTFTHTDSLYWNEKQINRAEAVIEAIWINSESCAKHILPHWITVDRLYYNGSGFVSNEIDEYISKHDWENAAKLWITLYNGEKKETKKKAKMAFNMALFFEMKNDIQTALTWLELSEDIFIEKNAESESKMCALYSKVLMKRLYIQEKLDEQLSK